MSFFDFEILAHLHIKAEKMSLNLDAQIKTNNFVFLNKFLY